MGPAAAGFLLTSRRLDNTTLNNRRYGDGRDCGDWRYTTGVQCSDARVCDGRHGAKRSGVDRQNQCVAFQPQGQIHGAPARQAYDHLRSHGEAPTPLRHRVCQLDDPDRKLGYYSPEDGFGIHIIDTNPHSMSAGGWLEDVSLVKKYEISEEAYNKRDDTMRKWIASKKEADPTWTLQKEMMRRKDPNWQPPNEVTDEEHLAKEASAINVGDRCQVLPGGRRGEVKFVGKVPSLKLGWWVGVALDEPLGL